MEKRDSLVDKQCDLSFDYGEKKKSALECDSEGRIIISGNEEENEIFEGKLKTSEGLEFLKDETDEDENKNIGIFDEDYWSLYENDRKLEPLKFTNGKNQSEVVKEVIELIKSGKKAIFIHGACGTGKSAIALNIARELGKACIVVPVKGLQRQYEEDYMKKKYVLKKNGKKMKIAMITGRENHDSIIFPGKSCADPELPDTIKISDRNEQKLKEYYEQNPGIKSKEFPNIKDLKRISIAPANPYWSPIVPDIYELPLKDAKKKRYNGLNGKSFVFYHRKQGCSYYDQYLSYINSDVLIFNSAKYKIETALDRKPETDVDIIDECDEFLDNFSNQEDLNLTRFYNALKNVRCERIEADKEREKIMELVELEERNKKAIGIDEKKIFELKDTYILKIIGILLNNKELATEIEIDEMNYANKALEITEEFKDLLADTYVTFYKREDQLFVSLVTTNLASKFNEIIRKNKAMVFMSGTLHSEDVLKNIFGIENFAVVDAETNFQGELEIQMTGKELDCRYSNLKAGNGKRKEYLFALEEALRKAEKPVLVHVNAYEDLPNEIEKIDFGLRESMSKETLYSLQAEDKTGRIISMFKSGMSDGLFSTKCSRGVDFPGNQCRSIVFTKYPNPNVQGIFWKVFQKTHPAYYWSFYKDKARREFLQRIYRGLRSKDDHVFILSPDSRVIESVKEIQKKRVS